VTLKKCYSPDCFDENFSRRILKLESIDELYKKVDCTASFKDIDIPTLLIISKDDPTFE
jgi:predicted alpha/beta-fold hydrolase